MFIQSYIKRKDNKEYSSTFLVESYRENGKPKHRHLANLSALPKNLLAVIQNELKRGFTSMPLDEFEFIQGKACGGLLVIKEVCKCLGILNALGKDKQAQLALLQIIARILCQKSRLYTATQWAGQQAIEEVLGINVFNEDTLYANLDWLSDNQEKIEQKIFKFRHRDKKIKTVYLYDVTSSYLEGTENELAAYGYNRDGKRGKMQIVIGLLCDEDGYPVSVEVFEGNTQDVKTVSNQLQKLKARFGVEQIVFVGDRGMIKSTSIDEILDMKWYYITAITKPQIENLLTQNVFQLELFTDELLEVKEGDIRYVLHRNPTRADEINKSREKKIQAVKKLVQEKNQYLCDHSRASEKAAIRVIQKKVEKLKISQYLKITSRDRVIAIEILQDVLGESSKLDGCYVIKSNMPKKLATTQNIHDRYKDLAMVEIAFRTMKQSFEEIRPIYVRKEKRTRGHVLVCMLAYMVIKYVWEQCKNLGINQTTIFDCLDRIQYIQYNVKNVIVKTLPRKFLKEQTQILDKLKIKMPTYL